MDVQEDISGGHNYSIISVVSSIILKVMSIAGYMILLQWKSEQDRLQNDMVSYRRLPM